MNLLAHAYLSGDNTQVLIGNMMGDSIKGYGFLENYDKHVATGVLLHRFIDDYMDNHELSKKGKKRIWGNYRHYSAVVMDVYYDHLLAKNWAQYSDETLEDFSQRIYTSLENNWSQLPEETQYMSRHMIKNDWFGNYVHLSGIERTFDGLSRRTSFKNNMRGAVKDLIKYLPEFEEEFQQFFKDIRKACHQKLSTFQSNG